MLSEWLVFLVWIWLIEAVSCFAEEERKRFRSQYDPTFSYANVGFQYKEEADIPNPGDEEYDPSACFENEEDEGMYF